MEPFSQRSTRNTLMRAPSPGGCYDILCPSTSDNTGHFRAFRDMTQPTSTELPYVRQIVRTQPKLNRLLRGQRKTCEKLSASSHSAPSKMQYALSAGRSRDRVQGPRYPAARYIVVRSLCIATSRCSLSPIAHSPARVGSTFKRRSSVRASGCENLFVLLCSAKRIRLDEHAFDISESHHSATDASHPIAVNVIGRKTGLLSPVGKAFVFGV
jgi:hypothetical protein